MQTATTDPDEDFEAFVQREKDRLDVERNEILARRAVIDDELAEVDRKMAGVRAYEAARYGRKPSARGTRSTGRRAQVLAVVKEHPAGIAAKGVHQALDATDPKAKQSIANCLAALKRADTIALRNGKYYPA